MYPRYEKALKRIENGELTNYRYATRHGRGKEPVLLLHFMKETLMVESRFMDLFDGALKTWEERAKYNAPRPPEEFADCNRFVAENGTCRILTEMLCITRGKCKFYKERGKE